MAYEYDSGFNVSGCKNDLYGLARNGIRQAISICAEGWYKDYYSFLAEKNKTSSVVTEAYFNDISFYDTCNGYLNLML